ncbi:DUF1800 domain-containing protein [Dokdonella sp.]|uniref:DUF1800 domain-containing protein n=1 Tax=Dokdonella sp. TaxID=2291710 RepID=UPI0031C20679|nr:DUF1800 domain-containing protein [Dokdonella sp.]
MGAEILGVAGAARRGLLTTAIAAPGPLPAGHASNVVAPPFAAYVLGRLGYGQRPGTAFSIAGFNALGANDDARLEAFVDEQLDPARGGDGQVVDAESDARLAGPEFATLRKSFDQLWLDHEVNGNPSGGPNVRDHPIREGERMVFVRALYSRWQLHEQLVGFWHDHFNVYGYDRYAAPTWAAWDRDVIRRHCLGNFRQMLEASFKSPAMLYYLDNYINRAPSFNENYAREVMELHTLGAISYLGAAMQQHEVPRIPAGDDGAGLPIGYVDADVYELARALTGWSFGNGSNGTAYDGHPAFINGWHDIGQKTVLGAFVPANTPPEEEIATFLDAIALHPGTGRYIALKLARRFISDEPPAAVIDHAASVFYAQRSAPDQIAQTVRALLLFDGVPGCFRDVGNFGNKVKRPFETVVSALRAVDFDYTIRREDSTSNSFMDRFRRSGHRPFDWRPPDGFPDSSDYWMSSMAFVHAWRTIDWALDEGTGSGQTPLAPVLAITLAEMSADPAQHTPVKLADFWLMRCFGWAPDAVNGWRGTALHACVRDFMCRNTDTISLWNPDVGIGAGPAGNLLGIDSNSSPNWRYNRLRGMVDTILFSPQFMLR